MKTIAEILSINYDNMEREIINFFNELGIEINFNKLNINEEGFLNTLKGVNQERLKNNPRFLSNQDLIDIYTFNTNLN